MLVALSPLLLPAPARAVAGPDSSRWRFETGASTDGTNELYYEGTVVDTFFLPRQRVNDPQVRYAAVALAALDGTRAQRSVGYLLQGELSYGDQVKRGDLISTWRQDWHRRYLLWLDQRLELRHDQTFGRDLREWRGDWNARLRRSWGGENPSLEWGARLTTQRSSGDTTGFWLDNTYGRASLALEQVIFLRREWGLSYRAGYRTFPDSANRDHYEHTGQARWRQYVGYASDAELALGFTRRQTRLVVSSTRDNFWLETGAFDASFRVTERWRALLRAEGERTRYDLPDDIYFDYSVMRGQLAARFEPGGSWSAELGPRGEWLRARLQPAEDYLDLAADLEFFSAGRRSYYSFSPAVGRREYLEEPSIQGLIVEHSSYTYVALDGYFDHLFTGNVRLRGSGGARWEQHTRGEDDAHSLYFSLDLRRIF
jgi:hypothetical protein